MVPKFNVGDVVYITEGVYKGEVGQITERCSFGWRVNVDGWVKYPISDSQMEHEE
jgi:ribosomal protein L24